MLLPPDFFATPRVMAIVNATPDSFYAGSRTPTEAALKARIEQAAAEGADLLDIGGYSSRPGASEPSVEQEWARVRLALQTARALTTLPISVDTFRAEVARRALTEFGPLIINDISAGDLDPLIVDVAAEFKVPYIAMHMRGRPETMSQLTQYEGSIVEQVVEWGIAKLAALRARGVQEIILDPGFGFAKTLRQNYTLLKGLDRLCALGCPVLSGVSRKSMIYKLLGVEPKDALPGTIALGWESLRRGATILRVHDVREAVDTVKIFEEYERA